MARREPTVEQVKEATKATDAKPYSSRDWSVLEVVTVIAPLSDNAMPIDDTNEVTWLKSLYGMSNLWSGVSEHSRQAVKVVRPLQ